MTDFSGKTILVLGGSRGIGADIVRRFAPAASGVVDELLAERRANAEHEGE